MAGFDSHPGQAPEVIAMQDVAREDLRRYKEQQRHRCTTKRIGQKPRRFNTATVASPTR